MAKKLVVIGLVALSLAWIFLARNVNFPGRDGKDTKPEATQASVTAQPDPPSTVDREKELRVLVKGFVSAYYNRDETLYVGDAEQQTKRFVARLSPYVSDSFLERYPVFVVVPQEEAVVRQGGTITAQVKQFVGGEAQEMVVKVSVRVQIPGESSVTQTRNVHVLFSQEDDLWQIDAARSKPTTTT